ncbi:MAG: hypothetical protein AB7E32_14135 [Desulfovibrio sp.]
MLYRLLTVPNRGYAHPDAENPTINPVEIALLDNGPDEEFVHLGYDYPNLDGVTVRLAVEADDGPTTDKRLLLAYQGEELTDGEAVEAVDVVDLLVTNFGWPTGTALGEDGMPVAPGAV